MRRGLSTRRSGWGWGCVCVCDIYLGKWKTGGIFHPRCRHLIRVLNLWGVHVARVPSGFFLLLLFLLFWKAAAAAASIPSDSGSRCQVHFTAQEQHFWGKMAATPITAELRGWFSHHFNNNGNVRVVFFFYIHIGNYQGREMTVFVFFCCYSIFRRVRVRVLNCQWRRYDL